jgi:signal peptide peptidase SppA
MTAANALADIRAAASKEIWAINRQYLSAMLSDARNGQAKRQISLPRVEGTVAIIPIHGMITQRGSVWDDLFGGTSTMKFEAAFSRAYNNERIGAIVLDVDSPGGTTPGVQLAADRIYSTRGGSKPVVGVVNSMCDSAAYWLGSSAEFFIAVPGAWSIGNIGVYRMHEDVSEAMAKQGVKIQFISTPEFKTEGNPYEPLSAEARAHQQRQVDATYSQFNKTVARNRRVTPEFASEHFGMGRDFNAEQAAQMGLVDSVTSMEQAFQMLGVGSGKTNVALAASRELTEELCDAWESGSAEALNFQLHERFHHLSARPLDALSKEFDQWCDVNSLEKMQDDETYSFLRETEALINEQVHG